MRTQRCGESEREMEEDGGRKVREGGGGVSYIYIKKKKLRGEKEREREQERKEWQWSIECEREREGEREWFCFPRASRELKNAAAHQAPLCFTAHGSIAIIKEIFMDIEFSHSFAAAPTPPLAYHLVI